MRQRTQRPRLAKAAGAQSERGHQINRASGISVAAFNRINRTLIIPIARWAYRSYDYHRIARRACQPRGHHITRMICKSITFTAIAPIAQWPYVTRDRRISRTVIV